MQFYKMLIVLQARSMFMVLTIRTVLCGAMLFVSGAFLGIGNVDYQIVKIIHNVALALMMVIMIAAMYLLGWNSCSARVRGKPTIKNLS